MTSGTHTINQSPQPCVDVTPPGSAPSHRAGLEPGFPISRSLSTSRRRTDELGYRLERPIHFECKLNEPMHIGMRLFHPAVADHSVSINRQQVQRIFSFSLRSRTVTSFCSWLLLNEWIQRVEHALSCWWYGTTAVVVLPMSSGLHISGCTTPCLCCKWPSPLFASAC